MPGYVRDALIHFQHTYTKNTFAPSPYQTPVYGHKQQMAPIIETPTFTQKNNKKNYKTLLENSYIMPEPLTTQ